MVVGGPTRFLTARACVPLDVALAKDVQIEPRTSWPHRPLSGSKSNASCYYGLLLQ